MAVAIIDEVKRAGADATGGTQVPLRSPCGKLQRRLLQRVLDRMNVDLAADLDLNILAAESGYSRSHFLRTFRAAMGCSPHRWLIRLRVEQAKAILRKNSISLIDIALDCGFSSHAHFSKTFRQIVGVTPSDYRRSRSPNMQTASLFASNSELASTFHNKALPPNVRLWRAGNAF
jgi:transcriptional regulator GlxA family with amidase domain